MTRKLNRGLIGALPFLFVLIACPVFAGSRTGFVSMAFSSCSVNVECPPQPDCEDSDFVLGECVSQCPPIGGGTFPLCSGAMSAGTAVDTWGINSQLILWGPDAPGPSGIAATGLSVEATRVDPQQLELHGQVASFVDDPNVLFDRGPVEIAVFRFSGDPTVFDGVDVESVGELVTLGLIQADDVLLSEMLGYSPGSTVPFDYSVDVTGVPNEEIVVFAAEREVSFVYLPALTAWGFVFLVVGFLMTATWVLRRRAGSHAKGSIA